MVFAGIVCQEDKKYADIIKFGREGGKYPHQRLPLMRELSIADFRQLTEGENSGPTRMPVPTTPQSKIGFEEPIFDSSPDKGSQGRMKVELLAKLKHKQKGAVLKTAPFVI